MSYQEDRLHEIAEAIRAKTSTTAEIKAVDFAQKILDIPTGIELPTLDNPGGASDVKNGMQFIDQKGNVVTGTMPNVTQATPTISISGTGLISAASQQTAGYIVGGTKTATRQMTTKGSTTITPKATEQIAVSSGTYVTGDIKVAAVTPSIPSIQPLNITENGTYTAPSDIDGYSPITVNVPQGGGDTSVEDALVERTVVDYVNNRVTKFGNYCFFSMSTLKTVKSTSATIIELSAFNRCRALLTADFSALTNIATSAFNGSSKFVTLILRNTSGVCGLEDVSALASTPIASGEGYIYVPSILVDEYKVATNWSTYADQIRAIEDYPAITG